MNEYHPEDTGAETPQEGTGPESGAEPRPARNEGFADASYIPRDRMPKTPRVYTYGESQEKKTRPEREKKSHRRMRGGTIVALCVVCILLGAVLGILAMDRLTGPAQAGGDPCPLFGHDPPAHGGAGDLHRRPGDRSTGGTGRHPASYVPGGRGGHERPDYL